MLCINPKTPILVLYNFENKNNELKGVFAKLRKRKLLQSNCWAGSRSQVLLSFFNSTLFEKLSSNALQRGTEIWPVHHLSNSPTVVSVLIPGRITNTGVKMSSQKVCCSTLIKIQYPSDNRSRVLMQHHTILVSNPTATLILAFMTKMTLGVGLATPHF